MTAAPRAAQSVMSYLRANLQQRSGAVRFGPFLASFDANSASRYRNYAVPEDGAQPTAADLATLVAGFTQRGRQTRLEYVPDVAPAVLPALSAAGFVPEGTLPLMACTRSTLQVPAAPHGIECDLVGAESELAIAAGVQNRAYGEPATVAADVARLVSLVARGGAVAVARVAGPGAAIGSGLYSIPQQGMTELAAVGVLEDFRGRGVAGYLTARLAADALQRGFEPFLMAASEREARLYRRVGFAECGRMLHISRPL